MRAQPLIALFTDFGTRDAYVAQMKGAILTICSHARLIDLSHDVSPFDVRNAAFLLAASVAFFPAGTIFVAVIDPGVGTERRPVMLQTASDKWLVGPDNGVFTQVMAREGFRRAMVLDQAVFYRTTDGPISATFHGRDIFGPIAAHLAAGMDPEQLGSPTAELLTLPSTPPRQEGDVLIGEVQHVDRFGNVVTNLTPAFLDLWPRPRLAVCVHRTKTHALTWVNTYGEGEPDTLLGLYNSDGFFEFALARGSAAALLDAQVGDVIELRPHLEA
jgi:S-adenosylmethionine hydrolase